MKKSTKKLLKTLGFKARPAAKKSSQKDLRKTIKYDYGEEAFEQIKIVRSYSMVPHINLLTLYEQVAFIEKHHIEGDFVECGVWKGGSMGLMALANLKHGDTRRNLHLFDVFGSGSEPNPDIDGRFAIKQIQDLTGSKSVDLKGRLLPVEGVYDSLGGKGTLKENQHLLERIIGYDTNKIHYHKGYFQHTLPQDAHEIEERKCVEIHCL